MKKIAIISLSFILFLISFAQINKENSTNPDKNEIHTFFDIRMEKGFYSIMQVSLMLGNNQSIQRIANYYPYPSSSLIAPILSYPYASNSLAVAPSIAITNGYMFNEHWAAGAGVGFEIFDHNLFPLFAELRYTL